MNGALGMFKDRQIELRLRNLEHHLKNENPVLSEVVGSFRELDWVSRRIGFFSREESHAIRTPWWPLISVLGLYSSGKSTFINYYLQYKLQATGNQAVDDKFTVISFTNEDEVRILPGLALDADPRFPLYKVSQAIEEVAEGAGAHIDSFLQLKTCPSEKLRGKILIDSPGFDADAQRTSILRITDHIMDLSDLVLVFFDARHPESGSMRDTLDHLVKRTIHRRDANKFLFILNQIDNTAREDNPEDVFASWQRALAQYGLTAGCCYAIYISEVAIPIEDEGIRKRFERKRDADLAAIYNRIEQVQVERAYRIVGMLEHTANTLKQDVVPQIQRFIARWRRTVLWLDGLIFGGLLIAFLAATIWAGYWDGFKLNLPLWNLLAEEHYVKYGFLALVLIAAGYIHWRIRRWATGRVKRKVLGEIRDQDLHENFIRAFQKNTGWRRTVLHGHPAGWRKRTADRLDKVLDETNAYIQKLNDLYTNPSGEGAQCMETPAQPLRAIHTYDTRKSASDQSFQPSPQKASAVKWEDID
jgi:hypothetical protein